MREPTSLEQPGGKHVLFVLAAGFALTILFLLASGWLSIQAMQAVEERSEALLAQHRISTRIIDEIQGEEAGLSDLFYALVAEPRGTDRAELLRRLDKLQQDAGETLAAARNETNAARWSAATVAVERFISEVRRLVNPELPGPGQEPPASLYHSHQALVGAISDLVSANYQAAIELESQEAASHRQRLGRALALLGIAVILAVACAVTTVRVAGRMYDRAAWQARELSRLSGHVMETQEEMLQRFSRELHDEFGQSLTAIEANLAAVPADSPEAVSRLEDCTLLVKDLMANVRELSQLLRPSTLDDFGLKPSLQWLADSFSQRTGIAVDARLEFSGRLPREVETHLFRIAQEALTNVTRHSGATEVELALEQREGAVRLTVSDNGGGLKNTSSGRGLGLAGMRERMRMSGGRVDLESGPRGVKVIAEVPLQ